jgi:hypothetical protein
MGNIFNGAVERWRFPKEYAAGAAKFPSFFPSVFGRHSEPQAFPMEFGGAHVAPAKP